MRIMSINQLLCLTRAEILEIQRTLRAQLPHLPVASVEHREAAETLTNIAIVLARPELRLISATNGPAP